MALITEAMRNAARHEAEIAELEELAGKRFWKIAPEDATRSRFFVEDSLGRPIYGPQFPSSIRGFFAGLPPQA
jgi:hypothetical protein